MQTWNFNIQRKLPADTVAEIAYSGSRGVHLMGLQEWDQLDPQFLSLGTQLNSQIPNPFFGQIQQGPLAAQTITRGQSLRPYPQFLGVTSTNANYGQSLVSRHASPHRTPHVEGLSVLAAYTVAKLIDNMIPAVNGFPGESFSGGPLQNFYNIRGERALASWDTPQTLVLSYVYELPFGRGKRFPVARRSARENCRWVADQRQLHVHERLSPYRSTAATAAAALPVRSVPIGAVMIATLSGTMTERLLRYFDTSAFSFNAPFTFGNAPRLMPNLRSPGDSPISICR